MIIDRAENHYVESVNGKMLNTCVAFQTRPVATLGVVFQLTVRLPPVGARMVWIRLTVMLVSSPR